MKSFVALFVLCLCLPAVGADKKKPGAVLWAFKTDDSVMSSPAIGADGTVYVGSEDNKLYALDGKKLDEFYINGVKHLRPTKLWDFETGDTVASPAIGSDGTVYVGSSDKKVYALDGKTGRKKWEFKTGGGVGGSPAIGVDGTVYVGSYDHKVYALDGKTGRKKWEFRTGGFIKGAPTIGSDGTVYVGSNDRKVYALDGKTGAEKWEYETGYVRFYGVESSPAIGSDGTVYVGSTDRKVYALDGKTGAKKWVLGTGNQVTSSPTIGADGTLYIGSQDNNVYAIETASNGPAKSPWPMRGQNAQHTGRVMKK